MKKRMLCLLTSSLLVVATLVGCATESEVEEAETKEEIEAIVVDKSEEEYDSEEENHSDEETEAVEEYQLVELTDEIKNSSINDSIIQIGKQIVNLDGSVTYLEFIEICNNELEVELMFHDQYKMIYDYDAVYCDANGRTAIGIGVINPNYPEESEAKDCVVVAVENIDDGQCDSVSQNIIYAGNLCSMREDCSLLYSEGYTEEEINAMFPEELWNKEDNTSVEGRDQYYYNYLVLHPNNLRVLITTSISTGKNNDDGKIYIFPADKCPQMIKETDTEFAGIIYNLGGPYSYLQSVLEADKQAHPECY